ncbi:MAG: hypothetical protein ACYS80_17630 [Planctomycetota bacterium]|jgi:hypothetical protein
MIWLDSLAAGLSDGRSQMKRKSSKLQNIVDGVTVMYYFIQAGYCFMAYKRAGQNYE